MKVSTLILFMGLALNSTANAADCRPSYQAYLDDHSAPLHFLVSIPCMAMPPLGIAALSFGAYSAATNPRYRKALRVINDAYAGGGKTLRKVLKEVREEVPDAQGSRVAEIIVEANEKGAFCEGDSLARFDDFVGLAIFELLKEKQEAKESK
jgi:hypothetical protein